jgi:hypothetical protein
MEDIFNKSSLDTNILSEEFVVNYIEEKGYLTGSRAWGVELTDSDYDYVLYGDDYHTLLHQINDSKNITSENKDSYLGGLYITINNKKYNIFTHLRDEVNYIKQTTDILKSFPKDYLITKQKRVYLFETIRATLKGLK